MGGIGKMPELLLEILSEEIPARMQAQAAADLKRLVNDGLKAAGLEFDSADLYATPRRLTLVVDKLPERTPDISEERRGPRTDAPEKAVEGFLGSIGLTLDQVEKRETDKGEFYFAVIEKKGQATAELLKDVIEDAMQKLPWPKSMRWADYAERWVRPIHSILCLFDGDVVPVSFGAFEADRHTKGHRFLTDALVSVKDFADYKKSLETGFVLIDPEDRKAKIKADAEALAANEGLVLRDDPALLDEVAGLVEWPVVLKGGIDDEFMDVPPEVLTATMRKNQKYFSLETKDGAFANKFILVANKETPDGGAAIVAGNERVLRARLADAKFFWDQDRKQSLASCAPQLKDITFHAKLGSLDEKVDRVQALAAEIAGVIGADKDKVRSAARLAKADLVTGMVTEFPEVQGIMGRYYAQHDGESDEVAQAIAEHYSPLGPSDACPTAPVSVAVALADKIDTLVGFWAIDEKPTGSKDPFALRRAALGVIRLVVENKLRLPLRKTFINSLLGQDIRLERDGEAELADLLSFFADRLKVHLREQGVRHDLITAVFLQKSEDGAEDDLIRLLARVEALGAFLETDDGANLLTAYKRAANILRIEEKKDDVNYHHEDGIDDKLLSEKAESELYESLVESAPKVKTALDDEDFAGVMRELASTRALVDKFFDDVTVNADDAGVRANRLKLLSLIRSSMNQIADFSQIEGGER